MHCDERQDMMFDYLLDSLPQSERAELRDHLSSGCPVCTGRMAEAEAVIAQLPLSLPAESPRDEVRERLMIQIEQSQVVPVAAEKHPEKPQPASRPIVLDMPSRRSWIIPIAASGVAALLAVVVTYSVMNKSMERLDNDLIATKSALKARNVTLHELEQQFDEIMVDADLSHLQLVHLHGDKEQPTAQGRIIWDVTKQRCHLFIYRLAEPEQSKTYQLWFVTETGQNVSAGTFTVNDGGRAVVSLDIPTDLDRIASIGISNEPLNGSDQPTGAFHLQGAIN